MIIRPSKKNTLPTGVPRERQHWTFLLCIGLNCVLSGLRVDLPYGAVVGPAAACEEDRLRIRRPFKALDRVLRARLELGVIRAINSRLSCGHFNKNFPKMSLGSFLTKVNLY